jgi:WYL domain
MQTVSASGRRRLTDKGVCRRRRAGPPGAVGSGGRGLRGRPQKRVTRPACPARLGCLRPAGHERRCAQRAGQAGQRDAAAAAPGLAGALRPFQQPRNGGGDHQPGRARHGGYLVAYGLEASDWRTFRVDRISDPVITRHPCRQREPPAADLHAYVTAQIAAGMLPGNGALAAPAERPPYRHPARRAPRRLLGTRHEHCRH